MRNRRHFLLAFASLLAPTSARSSTLRKYRVDATVTFLGIPIFSRSDVGSCDIAVERRENTVVLRFQAGSTPSRTRGLNRLGYIQEVVTEKGAEAAESTYFGFMTASGEESLDQAKAALGGNGKDAVVYTAVEGSATTRSTSYNLFSMKLPPSYDFTKCEEVVKRVRESIGRKEIPATRQETASAETARTFLYAVRLAMVNGQSKTSVPFLYNGKRYKLDSESVEDRKMAQQFASRKLTGSPDRVLRLNGAIQNVATRDKTTFRLWYEQGSETPIRFEYKAKSYLNLAFEQA